MRIIAGDRKGIILKPVPGSSTRPTTDKIKEAIFNMIGPYFQGGLGLDLYAGSGALGIEALSRGLSKVIFVDRDRKAIQTIKWNLERSKYSEYAEVYRNEAKNALKALKKRDIQFSYIFLDPPYNKKTVIEEIETLLLFNLLHNNGQIIVEHSRELELPDIICDVRKRKSEGYGSTVISIYFYEEE
ncbi:16S rRNA (guanine(966)-N(2))-methyltransferase RsmD [Pueribacillus sp. YX66]|uniref:16S rRNA (guanine(966)-N(2))-methyltransferase RsmD n=1 Tax=Pueribacillus sp. YX66 TaxID=3229242 RepID=UPI00358D9E31